MGVPRARKTKSHRNQRRSHMALSRINTATCKNCGLAVMPHDVCGACGFYRGRQVLEIKSAVPTKKTA